MLCAPVEQSQIVKVKDVVDVDEVILIIKGAPILQIKISLLVLKSITQSVEKLS